MKKKHINKILENDLNREKKLLLAAQKRTREKLNNFEAQYDMSSEEFLIKYQAGKTDERDDFIDWAGEYHIFMSISEQLQHIEG